MSSNTLTFTCIGNDASALAALHQRLTAAIGTEAEQWPEPLRSAFDDWERPYVTSASLHGQTLRFVIDSSSGDELEKSHFQALHAAGAEHIRVRTFYSQVGETKTIHIHGGKRIAAKLFPQPPLTEGERLYELVLEGKDTALAKEIKAGASPDAIVDGKPLLVHVARASLEKSFRALLDAQAALAPCLPWVQEVAAAIQSYGGGENETFLHTLISAPGADAAALWRSNELMRVLSRFPRQLAWLLAQDGVDVNAMLISDEVPPQEMGSLLFNSVELFEDSAETLDVLAAHGARSIRPTTMPDQRRIDRLYWRCRDAETIPQMAAAGVNLDTPVWNDFPLLRNLMRRPCAGLRPLTMANALLDAGASADFWMKPDDFRHEVLSNLFTAKDRVSSQSFPTEEDPPFDVTRDGALIVDFMRGLLERGLDANMEVTLTLTVMVLSRRLEQDIRYPRIRYRGPLLGAIACLLCGRGSDMRPLCLPLVELLMQHGASPQADAVAVTGPWQGGFSDVYLHGQWPGHTWHFASEGSVLERLRQRQADEPDDVDAQVIAALEQT
ncbi:hypothetical protein ACQ859_20405 [Roseateles chitinivorans]|uniref:hypothetical protein n=1 Tax=Roseateles chitinivorans TaxID=2917965 RepID=UPI003D6794C3